CGPVQARKPKRTARSPEVGEKVVLSGLHAAGVSRVLFHTASTRSARLRGRFRLCARLARPSAQSPRSSCLGASLVLPDVNPVPESHVLLDGPGRGRRLRVVPRGVLVGLSVHYQRVVSRRALPRAAARRRILLQEFLVDDLW